MRCASTSSACATQLEFFRDVLGPETPGLIKATVSMQDLLGALQDAYVAEGLIGEFLTAQKAKRKKRYAAGELADVEAYLETQRAVQQDIGARGSLRCGPRSSGWTSAVRWPWRLLRCERLIMLENLDPSKKLKRKEWDERREPLNRRLKTLQAAACRAGMPVIVLFEGWDVAGKGPCLAALTQALDPRGFKAWPIHPAQAHELNYPLALALLDETAAARRDRHLRPKLVSPTPG